MALLKIRSKIARGCLKLCGKLPLNFLYDMGRIASWFLEKVMQYRKDVIYTNIARAFPEFKYSKVRQTAKEYYRRLGEIIAETIWFGGCTGKHHEKLRKQKICVYTNPELLLELHAQRGIMAMLSHRSNWEISGGMNSYVPDEEEFVKQHVIDDVYVVYKPLRNKVSDYVFYENRRAPIPDFQGIIPDSKVMRHAVSNRKKNPIYLMIADHYPSQAKYPVGKFLNQDTVGMLGSFSLAAKLGFAVLYMHMDRVDRGHYTVTFETITEDATGQDPEALMREYYRLLEEDIKRDPANWLWSHKRWK